MNVSALKERIMVIKFINSGLLQSPLLLYCQSSLADDDFAESSEVLRILCWNFLDVIV